MSGVKAYVKHGSSFIVLRSSLLAVDDNGDENG